MLKEELKEYAWRGRGEGIGKFRLESVKRGKGRVRKLGRSAGEG